MVAVKSCYTVIPAEPTPNGSLYLSECDQIKPWTHTPIVYIYRPYNIDSVAPAIEILRNSLSQVLVHFYPLAGRLRWTKGGRLELHCNAMGAQLLEAESEERVDDFGDFCPSQHTQKLIPEVDYGSPIDELPLLVVQLTKFSCGGLSIGVGTSHIVADGWSGLTFINSWAKLARGENLEVEPFHDRTVLRPCEPLVTPKFTHNEFTSWPLLIGCSDNKEERKKETSVVMLKLTRKQIEILKQRANEIPHENMGRPYSRYEAVAGHIWRCACKARAGDNTQPTSLRILADCRNRLNPPLPKGYFGNAAFPSATPTCLFGDLISKPLSYAAGKIREATANVTDEYIRSSLDFLKIQQNLSLFRTNFHTKETMMEGTFLGNPNISSNSWASLPLYDADFGWGKPIYMGPASLVSDGKFVILPTSNGDGSFAIPLCLQVAHIDALKMFFYEDI